MEVFLSFVNVMFVGWMWDRIRRLEKAVAQLGGKQALEDAAADQYRSNW